MVRRASSYLNGRDALNEVDQKISAVRDALSSALSDVESFEARQVEIRKEQAEAYGKLASIRLDIVAAGVSLDDLEGAEQKALELLERHASYADDKQAAVDKSADGIGELEEERREAAKALDLSIELYENKVEEIENALDADEAYNALLTAHEEAQAIVVRSEQKLELARDDRENKGAPYDEDPLLSYL